MARALIAGIADGGIYALLAFGLVLVYRDARVINLAHAEIGTTVVLVATVLGVDMWPTGAIVCIALGALVAMLFEFAVVSRMTNSSRNSVTVATIALALLLLGVEVKLWQGPSNIPAPIEGLGPRVLDYLVAPNRLLALALSLLLGLAFLLARRTNFGLATVAASQNRTAALLVGVPVPLVSVLTWGAGGVLAATSALLAAPLFGALAPGAGPVFLVRGLAAAIIGGVNRPLGPLVGGVAVGIIDSVVGHLFVRSQFPGLSTVVLMIVIVGLTVVRPLEVAEPVPS